MQNKDFVPKVTVVERFIYTDMFSTLCSRNLPCEFLQIPSKQILPFLVPKLHEESKTHIINFSLQTIKWTLKPSRFLPSSPSPPPQTTSSSWNRKFCLKRKICQDFGIEWNHQPSPVRNFISYFFMFSKSDIITNCPSPPWWISLNGG